MKSLIASTANSRPDPDLVRTRQLELQVVRDCAVLAKACSRLHGPVYSHPICAQRMLLQKMQLRACSTRYYHYNDKDSDEIVCLLDPPLRVKQMFLILMRSRANTWWLGTINT